MLQFHSGPCAAGSSWRLRAQGRQTPNRLNPPGVSCNPKNVLTLTPSRTTPATRWRTRANRLRATPMQHNRRASSSAPTHSPAPSITRVPLSVKRSDAVDACLRSGVPALAPHEWKGGEHAWLIDVISPFEKAEGYVAACGRKFMAGKKVSRLEAGTESVRVEVVVGVAG